MKYYRLNRNQDSNGNNQVHSDACVHYSLLTNFASIGLHSSYKSAMRTAKARGFTNAGGCIMCSPVGYDREKVIINMKKPELKQHV